MRRQDDREDAFSKGGVWIGGLELALCSAALPTMVTVVSVICCNIWHVACWLFNSAAVLINVAGGVTPVSVDLSLAFWIG